MFLSYTGDDVMSQLSRDQKIQVIGCLTEGMNIRAIELPLLAPLSLTGLASATVTTSMSSSRTSASAF
jgi:hypothetical protein